MLDHSRGAQRSVSKVRRFAAQLGCDPVLQNCPWDEPAVIVSRGPQGLLVQQFSHRCNVLAIHKRIAPACKNFTVVVVAEVDVPNIRVNPSPANLEDFDEVICIDCRQLRAFSPTRHYNRRGLRCRVLVLRKRISCERSERRQNEEESPHHYSCPEFLFEATRQTSFYHQRAKRQSFPVSKLISWRRSG